MATLKLKPARGPSSSTRSGPQRAPVRGSGSAPRPRPTLAQAQSERAERAARAAQADTAPPARPADRRTAPPPEPNVGRHARPLTPQRSHAVGDLRESRESHESRESRHRDDDRRGAGPRHGGQGPRHADDRRGARPSNPANASRPAPERGPRDDGRPRPARPDGHAPSPRPPTRSQPAPSVVEPAAADGIRLSKRMSALGIASRREADEWIPRGWVQVDGRVVDQLGARVRPDQRITVDARARFVQAQKVTVLLHKPLGYVSGQAEDGHAPASVLVQRDRQWRGDASGTRFLPTHLRGLAPAGRLDLDSTGLLVLTQDGRIARQLIGDDSSVDKEYRVEVAASHGRSGVDDAGLALLRHGLALDGVPLRPAEVERNPDGTLRFVLREGRKRQIRRMCEAVGLQVVALQRVRIGGVRLGDLPPGQWRYLRGDEAFAPLVAATEPAEPVQP